MKLSEDIMKQWGTKNVMGVAWVLLQWTWNLEQRKRLAVMTELSLLFCMSGCGSTWLGLKLTHWSSFISSTSIRFTNHFLEGPQLHPKSPPKKIAEIQELICESGHLAPQCQWWLELWNVGNVWPRKDRKHDLTTIERSEELIMTPNKCLYILVRIFIETSFWFETCCVKALIYPRPSRSRESYRTRSNDLGVGLVLAQARESSTSSDWIHESSVWVWNLSPKKPPKTDLFGLKFDTQTEGLGMNKSYDEKDFLLKLTKSFMLQPHPTCSWKRKVKHRSSEHAPIDATIDAGQALHLPCPRRPQRLIWRPGMGRPRNKSCGTRWDFCKCTLPETNIALENRPSQKEIYLSTIHFQGPC